MITEFQVKTIRVHPRRAIMLGHACSHATERMIVEIDPAFPDDRVLMEGDQDDKHYISTWYIDTNEHKTIEVVA